jgi:predicted tellurium resistance membrane protein TerC
MIQRIQTIWLLLATLCFLSEWIPSVIIVKTLTPDDGIFADQALYTSESMPLMIGAGVSGLLAMISVFLYKERTFQILVSATASLMQLLLYIGATFLILNKTHKINEFSPQMGFFLGMTGIVFIWLASRAIRRDQEILRSSERLR